MSFRELTPKEEVPPGEHWMSVTKGMSGYFAVEYWMNNEEPKLGTFVEPWDTGVGRYRTEVEASVEAFCLAQDKNLPYRLNIKPGNAEFDRLYGTNQS